MKMCASMRLSSKGDRHRVFAPGAIRDPAEEGPRRPVHDIVEDEGDGQCRRAKDKHAVGNAIALGDQGYLRGCHQSARRDGDEHEVEEPEDRVHHNLRRREAPDRLREIRGGGLRHLAGQRRAQQPGECEDDGALAKREDSEGHL